MINRAAASNRGCASLPIAEAGCEEMVPATGAAREADLFAINVNYALDISASVAVREE